jgi:hypothetical protein
MSDTPWRNDGYDCFRRLIQQLRDEQFDRAAQDLDVMLNQVAWTTGSELTIELGVVIRDFERSRPDVSSLLRSSLDDCIRVVRRVWPDFSP